MSPNTPGASETVGCDRYDRIVAEFAPQERTLRTMLQRQADRYGDTPFVTCGDVRWTFAETAEVARTWGARLVAAGIGAGDRVMIHCSNRAEFLQIYLGATWIGAIATPVNTAFRGAQLAHVLANASPRLLIVEEQFQPAYADLGADAQLPPLIWPVTAQGIQSKVSTAPPAPRSLPGQVRATPPQFSTPRAPPDLQKGSAARRRSFSGGASIRPAPWTCAKAMC